MRAPPHGSMRMNHCCLCLQSVGASAPQQEPTGLPLPTLQWVGQSICQPRPGAAVHPAVTRLMQNRRHVSCTSCLSTPVFATYMWLQGLASFDIRHQVADLFAQHLFVHISPCSCIVCSPTTLTCMVIAAEPLPCSEHALALSQSKLPCRKMMADADSRVDFAMAEALAFGALALHRGVGPASALQPAPGSDVDDSDLDDEVSCWPQTQA